MTVREKIAGKLSADAGQLVDVTALESETLTGGYVAKRVILHRVTFQLASGIVGKCSVVQKFTGENEVRVMRLLDLIAQTDALPRLICDGSDEEGPFVLLPFIEGERLEGSFTLPPDVISCLERVHDRFEGHVEELSFLDQVNDIYWLGLLDGVESALARVAWSVGGTNLRDGIARLRSARQVPAKLAELPQTLLHGDVHGGNMISSSLDNRTYLFDWGNAKVGPAVLDLVNCAESLQAPGWQAYWARAKSERDHKWSRDDREMGFHAATAVVQVQYLPFAIVYLGEAHAMMMMRKALAAVDALAG